MKRGRERGKIRRKGRKENMKRENNRFLKDALVVSILLLVVLVIPSLSKQPISGTVVSPISLSKTTFVPSEQLSGNLKIKLNYGDLIPEKSKIYFYYESPKCPKYYFCNSSSDGYIPWCNLTSSGTCNCITSAEINQRCGAIEYLQCENPNLTVNSFCCEKNGLMGQGEYYQNLECSTGDCWGNCQRPKVFLFDNLIDVSLSSNKGNYTFGEYRNIDKTPSSLGTSGLGFSTCGEGQYYPPQQVPLFFQTEKRVTGYATQTPTEECRDYDGDEPYIYGSCSDPIGTYYDYCSQEVEGVLNEYTCPEIVPNPTCQIKQYQCPYGCQDGACLEQAVCYDSDSNSKSPHYVKGTCTDQSNSYTDYCSIDVERELVEYYCPSGVSPNPSCQSQRVVCPYGCERGACLETSPQPLPSDLTASNIRHVYGGSGITGGGQEKKLYVTISNIGTGNAGTFIVCAYFEGELPIFCFEEITIIGLAHGASMDIDLGNPNVEGKTVVVHADFTNVIQESDEKNNIISKSFEAPAQCYDSDGGSLTVKGRCNDGTNVHEDECMRDGRTLKEWDCGEAIGLPGQEEICIETYYDCINLGYELGCVDGICKEESVVIECEDPDGHDHKIKGTCSDQNGQYTDSCTQVGQNPLIEYYCDVASKPGLCIAEQYTCLEGCEDGACIESYSCDDWDNEYIIELSALSIYAPPTEGVHAITGLFLYSIESSPGRTLFPQDYIELSISTISFEVDEQTQQTNPSDSYKGCVNQQCVLVQGSSDNQCSNNADCTYTGDTTISCVNYVEVVECVEANCYWYDNSCHSSAKRSPSLAAPISPVNLEEELKNIAWWVWLIIGIILALIITLFIVKKVLPMAGKSNKEERTELRKKYPALVAYINRAKNKGMLREQLKAKLNDRGWPSNVVDKAINEFW